MSVRTCAVTRAVSPDGKVSTPVMFEPKELTRVPLTRAVQVDVRHGQDLPHVASDAGDLEIVGVERTGPAVPSPLNCRSDAPNVDGEIPPFPIVTPAPHAG